MVEKVEPEEGLIILRRWRYKGRGQYDGLNLPKEEGDYALTEVKEGSRILKHTYFGREGNLKGEFFNINTPVELYPGFIRYVDLEVDVVRWPDGQVRVVDEEELQKVVSRGCLMKPSP
ncbi:MAG: DUF402 domain-containing protein [Anaerolineae bacterium]|nr:DUF402 domain-containing protein [Anaerolineae bacterium]